ncbi:MAG: TetR family transcriptional regulator [Acidimicrobiales bacterium]
MSAPGTAVTGRSSSAGGGRAFTVSVLSERTGTSVPTIHHYRRCGLLPPPTRLAPNRFLYDERHVAALVAIRYLRERWHLPLDTARQLLPELLAAAPATGARHRRAPAAWEATVEEALARRGCPAAQQRLLAEARQAFATHGYRGVNVGEICEAAGIAKGSFYRYFDSKQRLFDAAVRSTVDLVGDQLDRHPAMSEKQAVAELGQLLRPFAPLLLEVATSELRRQREPGVSREVLQGLAARLSPRLRARGASATASARRAVDAAILGLFRPALGLR